MNVVDRGVFESHTAYEQQRAARHYFERVISAYNDVRNIPPITAISLDPEFINPKLGPDLINYLIDVEHASRKALKHNDVLFEQWKRVVNGEDVPNIASIAVRCGRVYRARKLLPVEYFKVIKQGRRDRRSVVGAA